MKDKVKITKLTGKVDYSKYLKIDQENNMAYIREDIIDIIKSENDGKKFIQNMRNEMCKLDNYEIKLILNALDNYNEQLDKNQFSKQDYKLHMELFNKAYNKIKINKK